MPFPIGLAPVREYDPTAYAKRHHFNASRGLSAKGAPHSTKADAKLVGKELESVPFRMPSHHALGGRPRLIKRRDIAPTNATPAQAEVAAPARPKSSGGSAQDARRHFARIFNPIRVKED